MRPVFRVRIRPNPHPKLSLVPSPPFFRITARRPLLARSDSVSRKRPFSTGFFRLYSSDPYRQSSRFFSFCALPRGVWCEQILLYGSRKSVGSCLLPLLRAFSASNACFARDEPSSKRVGGVGLSRKPPKLCSWRCTQRRVAKVTAGVAVVGKMASVPRAAAV